MMEREGWTGRMLGSVCVVKTRKREHKQPVGTEQQGIEFFTLFIRLIHERTFIPHTYSYILTQTFQKHANYNIQSHPHT